MEIFVILIPLIVFLLVIIALFLIIKPAHGPKQILLAIQIFVIILNLLVLLQLKVVANSMAQVALPTMTIVYIVSVVLALTSFQIQKKKILKNEHFK